MNKFPEITHISDVLPHIENRPEFVVADREDHIIINYVVSDNETFPSTDTLTGQIRRECRGIIFDKKKGHILRRPYHKFFNLNEREETLSRNVDFSQPHIVLEKLDGSMIVPYVVDGRLIWGTKMGDTDVAKTVTGFLDNNPHYREFAEKLINGNYSPIFEWCSRKQRIVIDYPEDRLVLTAVRDLITGEYLSYASISTFATVSGIDCVQAFSSVDNIDTFVEKVRAYDDQEGVVVRFADGNMIKVKGDWYVSVHKAKDALLYDRNIVEMIINNTLDDVKAALPAEDRVRLEVFESQVVEAIDMKVNRLHLLAVQYVDVMKMERKNFALNYPNGLEKTLMFSVWEKHSISDCTTAVLNAVRKSLTSNANYSKLNEEYLNVGSYAN